MENNVIQKRERLLKARSRTAKTVTYILLTVWAVAVLFPFFWMLLTSIKSYSEYSSEFIPKFYTLFPTLENYKEAFSAVPLAD